MSSPFSPSGKEIFCIPGFPYSQMSKRPNVWVFFRFAKKICWIWYFLIFLDFFHYLGNKKSYQRAVGVEMTRFLGGFQKIKDFLWIFSWITCYILEMKRAIRYFEKIRLIFISGPFFKFLTIYLRNEKRWWKSSGVKTTGFFRAFHIFAWTQRTK